MVVSTLGTFNIMRFLVEANTSGLMVKLMMDNGTKIKCMDMELWCGRMERDMKGTLVMIKEMVKEHLSGKMEEFMMVLGKMESNMEEENL